MRVLVVEDARRLRQYLVKALTRAGHAVDAGRAVYLRFMPRVDPDLAERGFEPTSEHELLLALARPTTRLAETRALMIRGLVLFGCLLPVALLLVVSQAVRRGLKPVRRLAGTIGQMDATSLASRVALDDVPEEIRPVVGRLNELFERLETAFARERRLTADMAHELRTPIAELRILAELGPDDDAHGPARDTREVLEIALQMERQVNTLLALAGCDSAAITPALENVELDALVDRAWRAHRDTAERRQVDTSFRLQEGVLVKSDPGLLQAIVGNLLSNAAVYAAPGSRIDCEVVGHDGRVDFRLSNSAAGLENTDLPKLFEPFWRKDPARSDGTHTGLGLTLVKSYASLLELQVNATLSAPDLFTVSFSMPAAS